MEIVHLHCANCGCGIFIPRDVVSQLKESLRTFYCLNGHAQSYTKSTADILRETITRNEQEMQNIKLQLNEAKAELYAINHPPKRRAKRI